MTDLMEQLASDWELTLKAANRSADTIRLYRRHVRYLGEWLAEKEFEQLRDCAMIRLFLDTGVRVSGLAGITVDDVNFETDTVRVVLKGGSDLVLPFGAKTSDALRRYRRARAREPKADRFNAVWLATRGRGPLKAGGIRQMLKRRGADAKLPDGVNPHMFRHYFAHTWLANGGQETDLMRLTGVEVSGDGRPVRRLSARRARSRGSQACRARRPVLASRFHADAVGGGVDQEERCSDLR